MLLMRVSTITRGNCEIRGYDSFFPVTDLELGAESSISDKGGDKESGGVKRDFVVKRNEPEEVSIDRHCDRISPVLMAQVIKSRTSGPSLFCTIDVSFVQVRFTTGAMADVKAFFMLRFGKARFVSWSLSGSEDEKRPTESVKFKYSQIAIGMRYTEDGLTYRSETSQSWDFDLNKECPELVPAEWAK